MRDVSRAPHRDSEVAIFIMMNVKVFKIPYLVVLFKVMVRVFLGTWSGSFL
jgi:hypothetical protein